MIKPWAFSRQSRHLTLGERQIALSIFGDNLKLDSITLNTAWWVLKNYAVSPNGHIYFNQADFKPDFSHESLSLRAWLVHELTHVWQVQQGIGVFRKALFDRRYSYALQMGKPFLAYGVEQQARMVEDMYKQRECGQCNDALVALIPFAQEKTSAVTDIFDNNILT